MTKLIDLTGMRFGRFTVLKRVNYKWKCACDCGGTAIVDGNGLRSGRCLSCGCIRKEKHPNLIPKSRWQKYPSAERLRQVLSYDPLTGDFRWRSLMTPSSKPTLVAGRADAEGYLSIRLDGREHRAHRLAWAYVYGEWPKPHELIDHIDRNRSNNAISNLRIATAAQNAQNTSVSVRNTSGIKGVSWDKKHGRWDARIRVNGRRIRLGLFGTKEQAAAAYAAACLRYHRAFGRVDDHTRASTSPGFTRLKLGDAISKLLPEEPVGHS
jgi:hypothetical protein